MYDYSSKGSERKRKNQEEWQKTPGNRMFLKKFIKNFLTIIFCTVIIPILK